MTFTERHIIPILRNITNARLFNSERGFQGELLAELVALLRTTRMFPNETIIEQEHQKTVKHHGIGQRPDIIIHIPIEAGLTSNRNENNFYVIALKLNGNRKSAMDDFNKLDDMFNQLDYPEGVFINIGTHPTTHLQNYNGANKSRIHEISLALNNNQVQMTHVKFEADVVAINRDR
ncbi:MAG: hypothetical protein ACOYVG_12540 [Bacteroidota bacterium]